MKILNCSRCGKYLGEIEKGRILKDVTLYCSTCQAALSMAELEIKMKQTSTNPNDFNFLGDFLKGFNK